MKQQARDNSRAAKKRAIALTAGVLFIADSIYAATQISMNVGVVMPALIGLPLLLIGLLYPAWTRVTQCGIGRAFRHAVVTAYAAFVLFVAALCALMVTAAASQPAPGADAVIVLGASLHRDVPSKLLQLRLDAAAAYLHENPNALAIVSGGQGSGETRTEAAAMAESLIDAGIPASRIVLEERSTSTEENFQFSMPLLEARLGRPAKDCRIVYVTSGFHVYRAGLITKNVGIAAEGLAASSSLRFLPNHVLRECVAIAVTWLKGYR